MGTFVNPWIHGEQDREWIHDFFGGEQDLYGTAYTNVGLLEKRGSNTEEEVEGLIRIFGISTGSHILDWCGGWGRHAVPLARRGYKVTLLDFSKEYLERAGTYAEREGVSLNLVHADFRETPPDIQADYAINMFTAGIGYLSEEDDVKALVSLRNALKPGAHILIDTINLFWIIRNFMPTAWHESADGTKWYLEKRRFDFHTNTNNTACVYRDRSNGKEISCEHALRMYSPADLARILRAARFVPQDLFGDFDGSEFTLTSKRVVMTALRLD